MSFPYGATNAISMGPFSASTLQQPSSIAIGAYAGRHNLGANAIAIGTNAGHSNQHQSSIVINATGLALNTEYDNSLYLAPMRFVTADGVMVYNPTSKEVSYSNTITATTVANKTYAINGCQAYGQIDSCLFVFSNVSDYLKFSVGDVFTATGCSNPVFNQTWTVGAINTVNQSIDTTSRQGLAPGVYSSGGTVGLSFVVKSGTTPLMGVHSSGNVGIGTTNPSSKLHILGTNSDLRSDAYSFQVNATDAFNGDGSTTVYSGNSINLKAGDLAWGGNRSYGSQIYIGGGYSVNAALNHADIRMYTAGSERLTILGNGKVGIDTNTPLSKLTIRSNYSGGQDDGFCINATDGAVYNFRLYPFVQGGSQVGYNFRVNNIGSSVDAITIGYNGNIGIGSSSPVYKLSLEGDMALSNTMSIYCKNAAGTYEIFCHPRWSDNVTYLNYGSGGFNIRNNSSQSSVFLKHDGSVGIGNTTPSSKLDVSGILTANSYIVSSTTITYVNSTDKGKWFRIATVPSRGTGTIGVAWSVAGEHGYIKISFGQQYNSTPFIRVQEGNYFGQHIPQQFRLATDNSNIYNDSYVEMYLANLTWYESNIPIVVWIENKSPVYSSISLTTTKTDGTSTGYTYYQVYGYHAMDTNWNGARFCMANTGYVGIGTNDPSAKLHVDGDMNITNGCLAIGSGGTYRAGCIYSDTNWGMLFRGKQVPALAHFGWYSSAGDELMRLSPSGNLGLGTISAVPSCRLEVYGSTAFDGDTKVNFQCQASQYGRNRFYMTGRYEGSNDAWSFSHGRNSIIFRTQSSLNSAYTERWTIQNFADNLGFLSAGKGDTPAMVLNNNGNVGIGITNPLCVCNIIGTTLINGPLHLNSGANILTPSTNVATWLNGAYLAAEDNGSTGSDLNIYSSYMGGAAYRTVAFTNTGYAYNYRNSWGGLSDLSLKENIMDSRDYLDDVNKLRVVKYSFIQDKLSEPNQLGLIAQEVEPIFPKLITQDGSGIKSIKSSVITFMLVKCIQSLTKKINDLETSKSSMEQRISAMESIINSLSK